MDEDLGKLRRESRDDAAALLRLLETCERLAGGAGLRHLVGLPVSFVKQRFPGGTSSYCGPSDGPRPRVIEETVSGTVQGVRRTRSGVEFLVEGADGKAYFLEAGRLRPPERA